MPRLVSALLMILLLAACGSESVESCEPKSMPATGSIQKITHPHGNACKGLVMQCNYCVYDKQGLLKEADSESCGVCLGADF
jgi:hypothetical protein